MLITKNIKILVTNSKLVSIYRKKNINCKKGDIINIPIELLSKGSHEKVQISCDFCNRTIEKQYNTYNNQNKNGKYLDCCDNIDCMKLKRNSVVKDKYGVNNISQLEEIKNRKIETTLENFGVKHPLQSEKIKNKLKSDNLLKYNKEWFTETDEFKDKVKETCLEKYGVGSYSQTDECKEKIKNTCLEKYDFEYILQIPEIHEKGVSHSMAEESKEKRKTTNQKNYNVDYNLQSLEIKEKIKNTNIEKYGVEYPCQNKDVIKKIKQTNLEKYNALYYIQSDDYKDKISEDKKKRLTDKFNISIKSINLKDDEITIYCDKCSNDYKIQTQQLYNRFLYNTILCTNCNPIGNSSSGYELQLLDFIKENYNGIIEQRNRNVIGKELDIYLPELKIAFEFNGIYFHSELFLNKNYHRDKSDKCVLKDIQLIHIWEDDWLYKQDIIKSMILNKLNRNRSRIFARKCQIKEISDTKKVRDFLDNNHIQGFVNSSIKIGLFLDTELVSLMIFGNLRKNLGKKSKHNHYELLRFCNLLNINVIGSASKLLKYFLINYRPKEIITYADRSYSNGNLYNILGFNFIGKTTPNYFYNIKNKRKYRFNYRKDILVKEGYNKNKTEHEIMSERGIYRVYNVGNYKFEMKF